MDEAKGLRHVTMRRVASAAGITPMAIYKHFPNRDELLRAATAEEYHRIAAYFARANADTRIKGLRGMVGYLEYAQDHPNLFRYMFGEPRKDAFAYPERLTPARSPTLAMLYDIVEDLMTRNILKKDNVPETALSIWAHAHGFIALFIAGRIKMPREALRDVYVRSLNRLLFGLAK